MKIETHFTKTTTRELKTGELARVLYGARDALVLVIDTKGNALEVVLLSGERIDRPSIAFVQKSGDVPAVSYGTEWHIACDDPVLNAELRVSYGDLSGTITLTSEGHVMFVRGSRGSVSINLNTMEECDGTSHYDVLCRSWSIWVDDNTTETDGRRRLASYTVNESAETE